MGFEPFHDIPLLRGPVPPAPLFHAWRMGQINVAADAPYVILVQKGA